ncbi:MAG TPA: DUF2059 domain-containing protein, partial [Candidatus Bathyarchaeia archaeon]|nr:DUF2059 domain-containing protein [Candidatus Bathyarchaeia archaeon]
APRVLAQADTHQQAAEAFLTAMNTPGQLQEGIDNMVALMVQAQPMMAPYRETIRGFYSKYLSWDALKGDYITITKEMFTEAQLKTLTDFFLTEVGKDFIAKQPEMFQKTSELGYNAIQAHQDELMQLLEQEAQKFNEAGAGAAGQ